MATIDVGTKVCTGCKEAVPLAGFYRMRATKDGLTYKCKPCTNAMNRASEAKRMEHYRALGLAATRRYIMQNVHGISEQRYFEMLTACEGRCQACGRPEETTSKNGTVFHLAVDHDHATGAIRGLLCFPCNTTLGKVGDDPVRLQGLIDYLAKSKLQNT